MLETSTPESVAMWLAARLEASSSTLASRWLDRLHTMLIADGEPVFPSQDLLDHIPDLMREIAESLRRPAGESIAANAQAMGIAAHFGELRHEQRASVRRLLREYQLLSEVLLDFLQEQVGSAAAAAAAGAVIDAFRRVSDAVNVLQRQTVDAFVSRYAETIEQQTSQLRSFSRLVSHEMRQPLAVLHVIAHMFPSAKGEAQSAQMLEMLGRNIDRLAEVTGKLERVARLTRATDVMPREQPADLSALAADAALQLADAAAAHDVQVRVEENLPELYVDSACTELIFVNLIANGIKYSDPAKPRRVVQVTAKAGASQPTILVHDNGVGMPADRLRHVFREFVRAHAQRDDESAPHGFGLGLSIVRECMDAMGGTVRVQSREGEGTTFTLTWPAPAAVRLR